MNIMKEFNVIIQDFNSGQFVSYDIVSHLWKYYKSVKRKPKTIDEFKTLIRNECFRQWNSRCEYEIILKNWSGKDVEKKIDVYDQILLNWEVIIELLIKEFKFKEKL